MLVIGLTGGIGAGKSEVARLLAKREIPVINADKLSREVVEPGTKGLKAVIAKFGDSVLRPDGGLNRKGLAARVFENKKDRRSLEAILHPLIRERAEAHLGLLEESGAEVVVLESPLLFEASQDDLCDAVIVVVAREELRAQPAGGEGAEAQARLCVRPQEHGQHRQGVAVRVPRVVPAARAARGAPRK